MNKNKMKPQEVQKLNVKVESQGAPKTNSTSPEQILPDDDVDIDKLYDENKHFLNSFSNDIDGTESIYTENTDFRVNRLFKENEHFMNSHTYSEKSYCENIPDGECVEINEQVECYTLENKIFEKVFNNEAIFLDNQSVMSTDVKTEIASIKGFMGNEVSQRHYYMLIQNNNTLLNDAQQIRSKLFEKLAFIEAKLKDLEASTEDNACKVNYAKRYYSFRRGYFTDTDLFPAPANNDTKRKAQWDIIPNYLPQVTRWTMQHMEKMKKEIAKHILQKKQAELKTLKNKLSTTKPNAKTSHLTTAYSKLEMQVEYLQSLPETDVPLRAKNVDIDWDLIAARVRPEVNAEFSPQVQTGDDCRRMWELCLAPTINQQPWRKEEDARLEKLAKKNGGQNWDKIAHALGTNRTGFQAFTHYQLKYQKENYVPWSKREDIVLLEYLSKNKHSIFKHSSFMALTLRLPKRSRSDIKTRLVKLRNSTESKTKKGQFSDWEVRVMETCVKQGLTYRTIAQLLGTRTTIQVRDKLARKYPVSTPIHQKRKGLFTLEEDKRLMSLVVKYGIKSWSFIAKQMKTRDRTQCRHRYNNMIANINRGTDIMSNASKANAKSKEPEITKEENVEKILELLEAEPQKFVRAARVRRKKKNDREVKTYQKMFQAHTKADDLIGEYFQFVEPMSKSTQMALKEEVLEKLFTGDALLALLNYLEMKPDPELVTSYNENNASDLGKYWTIADYPFVIEWYRNKLDELNEMKVIDCMDAPCEDYNMGLEHYNLSNRFSISSLLQGDIDHYKSCTTRALITSRSQHSRIITNNNGATTCNSRMQPVVASAYFLPPSAATVKALGMCEKFKTETLVQNETIRDTQDFSNARNTTEGDLAKRLFESRVRCLLSTSHLLINGPSSQSEETFPLDIFNL